MRGRRLSTDVPHMLPNTRRGDITAFDGNVYTVNDGRATVIAVYAGEGDLPIGLRVDIVFHPERDQWEIPSQSSGITIVYVKAGSLSTGPLNIRIHSPQSFTIKNVTAAVNIAPSGSSFIADVNLNGTTIFTTQANRPTILSGTTEDLSSVPDVLAVAFNDVLTVDIDVPAGASDLVVQVRG